MAAGMVGPLAVAKPVSLPRHSLNGILKPSSQASCFSIERLHLHGHRSCRSGPDCPPCPLSLSPLLCVQHTGLLCLLSSYGSASVSFLWLPRSAPSFIPGTHVRPLFLLPRLDAVIENHFPVGMGSLTVSPEYTHVFQSSQLQIPIRRSLDFSGEWILYHCNVISE